MIEVFGLTLSKVGVLLIFIAVGYFLRRKGQLPESTGKVLSLLCTLIFFPAYSISSLSKNITLEIFQDKLLLIGYGALFQIVSIALAVVLSKPFSRSKMEQNSLIYAFSIPNYGYFGYPVIAGVFGQTMLADVMIFLIPMTLATSSFGYALFMKDKKTSVAKLLLTPMTVSLVIGVAIGLSGLKLPTFADDAFTWAGNCMTPCSMLLAGFMLGEFSLKNLLSGWRPYVYSAIRLIGIPVIFGAVLFLFKLKGLYLMLPLLVAGVPLGLNLVVFPESCGDEKQAGENAKLCFVSYLLALLIMPITYAILSTIQS